MPRTCRPALMVAVGVLAAGLMAGAAHAAAPQEPGFGGIVGDLDEADARHVVDTSDGPDTVTFIDEDDSGTLSSDEAVLL